LFLVRVWFSGSIVYLGNHQGRAGQSWAEKGRRRVSLG
jgi:hypothetical protein